MHSNNAADNAATWFDNNETRETGPRAKVLPLSREHVVRGLRGVHAAEDGPASAEIAVSDQRKPLIRNFRRQDAAARAAALYRDAHRTAGATYGETGLLLEVSPEYVGQLAANTTRKVVTARDILAGPASVCRAFGYSLVVEATPTPSTTLRGQTLVLRAAQARVEIEVERAESGGVGVDPAPIERAIAELEDATAGLRALVRLVRRGACR